MTPEKRAEIMEYAAELSTHIEKSCGIYPENTEVRLIEDAGTWYVGAVIPNRNHSIEPFLMVGSRAEADEAKKVVESVFGIL